MACLSRITDETHAQYFGNGHNKFYIEFRCNLPCIAGTTLCLKCASKSDTCKVQSSRKFPHGNINEPIPDSSHIFGGKWYYQACQKYGIPTEDVIQFAVKHQQQARDGFDASLYPALEVLVEKPKSKKKKASSPKASSAEESKEEVPTTVSKESKESKESKPRKTKAAKSPVNPYSSLVQHANTLVYKEVSLPTHLEKTVEEVDTEEGEVEYVTLQPFELHGASYFRDAKKNKLYKNVKQKIGEYIGRYDPNKEIIHTDLPDSDDEE